MLILSSTDVYRRELVIYSFACRKEFEDRREIAVPLPGNAATIIWTALRKRPLLCPPLTVVIDIGTEVDTRCLPKRNTQNPLYKF